LISGSSSRGIEIEILLVRRTWPGWCFGFPDIKDENNIPYDYRRQMKNKALTITVPIWLLPEIARECALQGRSRSNWFMWIFLKDLEKLGLSKES
jgi:hypothetical protein